MEERIKFGDYLEKHFVINPGVEQNTWKDIIKKLYLETLNFNEIVDKNLLYSEETINFIINVLEMKLAEIYEYELNFLETSNYLRIRLNNILSQSVFKLVNEFKILTTFSNKKLEEELSITKSNSKSNIGYAGFDLENQDGDFQKNTMETSNQNIDKNMFLSLIQRRTREWADNVNKKIVVELCRTLY